MKQSAVKTLGVAALGAAFAAAGAGAATAATAVPDAAPVLDTVTRTLPAENGSKTLPVAGNALEKGPAEPVTGLLGGLPAQKLPTQGVHVNGLPVG
ncbi:ATP-binding protein [Streptomyces lancefieldiae]|uniref:ATP-binding protein n=1 Tax=Streptomyces lancefieldiae TaxID=3075520 RepID=A0ABU3AJK2_9ACTN|nr:ATP-binding protein [Streptomyces sp. DSM 40712]MDT0610341.1 ATP-binding protein [Streptomyces sp. DSM 40712]